MSEYENKPAEYQGNMPKKGLYVFWMVVGFLTGVLWGALSISPMVKMNKAIADGDEYEAWRNAKKIRMFALIGIGVNVLFIIISLASNR